MIKSQSFESVWDALEVNPIKAENMKLRSFLMMAIVNYINETGLTQAEVWLFRRALPARKSLFLPLPGPSFT